MSGRTKKDISCHQDTQILSRCRTSDVSSAIKVFHGDEGIVTHLAHKINALLDKRTQSTGIGCLPWIKLTIKDTV